MRMRTVNTGYTVVLGAVIGAAVTWLWVNTGVMPGTVEPQSVAPQTLTTPGRSLPSPEAPARKSNGLSERARPAVSATSPSTGTIPVARDDSTYLRMLELSVSRPDAAVVTRRMNEMHERFVLTPDDPEWGRQTEKALRDFFHSRSANQSGGIEITSVSCRSAGCEVQAKVQMQESGEPPFAGGSPGSAAGSGQESVREDPRVSLREVWPLGQSLKQEDYLGSDLGESVGVGESVGEIVGFIVWYKRVEPKPHATSPGPRSRSAQ